MDFLWHLWPALNMLWPSEGWKVKFQSGELKADLGTFPKFSSLKSQWNFPGGELKSDLSSPDWNFTFQPSDGLSKSRAGQRCQRDSKEEFRLKFKKKKILRSVSSSRTWALLQNFLLWKVNEIFPKVSSSRTWAHRTKIFRLQKLKIFFSSNCRIDMIFSSLAPILHAWHASNKFRPPKHSYPYYLGCWKSPKPGF